MKGPLTPALRVLWVLLSSVLFSYRPGWTLPIFPKHTLWPDVSWWWWWWWFGGCGVRQLKLQQA